MIKKTFPNVEINDTDAVWDILNDIYESEDDARFISDEWDYIFRRNFVTDKDKTAYTVQQRFRSMQLLQ